MFLISLSCVLLGIESLSYLWSALFRKGSSGVVWIRAGGGMYLSAVIFSSIFVKKEGKLATILF